MCASVRARERERERERERGKKHRLSEREDALVLAVKLEGQIK